MNKRQDTRMLIVDDEEGMRHTLRRIMRAKGFEVEVAASGEDAIRVAAEFQPEIVLLDIRMPGMDGVQTFRRLKESCPEVVAVFMTAHASEQLARDALDEGAIKVLTKPIDIDLLYNLVIQGTARPILVVDDDPGFRTSLQRTLTRSGFRVYTAEGVQDALAQFKRQPRCVVLLDMKLNNISGLELLSQLRKLNQNVSAVLMTGFRELEAEMDTGLAAGACCTFTKPLDVDALVAAIRLRV